MTWNTLSSNDTTLITPRVRLTHEERVFLTDLCVCVATKNFDVVVVLKAGAVHTAMGDTAASKEYGFLGVDRVEFQNLYQFFESKKIPMRGIEVCVGSVCLWAR